MEYSRVLLSMLVLKRREPDPDIRCGIIVSLQELNLLYQVALSFMLE